MELSIIIVNFNTTLHLIKCINSIIENIRNLKYEIIVTDNNSTDKSIKSLPEKYKQIRFVFNDKNEGFGAGCNKGVLNASGKYFVFVNPDITLTTDVFSKLYDFMENNVDVGVCSGVLLNSDNEATYTYNYFPGLKWEFFEAIGRGSSRKIEKLLKHPGIKSMSNEPIYPDWVVGAFMFVRSNVYKMISGFNETFFLYYEDVDLQKRIKDKGYKIVVLPNIQIWHSERSSVRSFKGENLYYYHMTRSRILYYILHKNIFFMFIFRIMHISGLLFRISILGFRKTFTGKKKQKFYQYKFMLKLFFSTKNKIKKGMYTSKFENEDDIELIKTSNDNFWN
ncbi:MAG: glycosyltransferase family 2 protein [Ignavibacteriae bacterium]|nr:glycosyltransferase family 2 protein [Ignavibacteriota bacterium]